MKNLYISGIVSLLLVFSLIPSIIALDFDNVKTYDNDKKEVTITNSFGLGSDLAKIQLLSNTENCVECQAIMKVNVLKKDLDIFRDVVFKDLIRKGYKDISYSFEIGEKIDYNYTIPKPKDNINNTGNEKEIYIEGSYFGWDINSKSQLNNQFLNQGTYYIKLKGTKKGSERVDWIPNFLGVNIDEWAVWGETLVYDEINDSVKNESLWANNTIQSGSGSLLSVITETDDYLEAKSWSNSGVGQSTNVNTYLWTTNLTHLQRIGNVTLDLNLTCISDVDISEDRFYIFGHEIMKITCQANTITDRSIWTITKNDTGKNLFDIYNDSIFDRQITAVNNSIETRSISATGSGNGPNIVTGTFYYVYYNEYSPINSVTPSDNAIVQNNVNFTCNMTLPSNDIENISLYVDGSINHTESIGAKSGTLSKIVSNLELGSHEWGCSAYDNESTSYYSLTNQTFLVDEFSVDLENYNDSTLEFKSENFEITVSYNDSKWSSISANLIYNDTSYIGTKTGSGGTVDFIRNLNIPSIEGTGSVNQSFYWQIILTNSTGGYDFNSTEHNQTVNPIIFTNCNATYPNPLVLNISIFEETNISNQINVSMKASFTYSLGGSETEVHTFESQINNDTFQFCTNANETFYVDSIIDISKDGYFDRTYTLFNQSYNNVTTNLFLYLINESEGTNIIIEVVDQGLQPLTGYYVDIERYYPETNEYLTVVSDVTDEFGRFVSRLIQNYVRYKFIFKNPSGTIVKTTEDIRVACKSDICVLPFVIEDTTDDFDRFSNITNFESSLSFDNSTNIFTVSWNDVTGDSPTFRLFVQRILINGTINVCNTTSTSLSSSLSCNVGSEKASYRAQFFRQVDDDETRISVLHAKVGEIFGIFGKEGLIWVFLILFTMIAIGSFNPSVSAILYLVGIIGFGLIGIISFSIPVLIANIVCIIAFVWSFRG